MIQRGIRIAVVLASGMPALLADPAVTPAATPAAPHAPPADLDAARKRLRVAPGLEVGAWAAEPLVRDLTSVDFDGQGRAYAVETGRRRTSVFDVRNFKDWVEDDLALRTVPDRMRFLEGQLSTNAAFRAAATRGGKGGFRDFNGDGRVDARDLEVESERIRLVWDADGDGRADQALPFAEGFSGRVSGVAAGVLAEGTNVWFACIPDLWRLTSDSTRPAPAVSRGVLHTGFGVHVAFGGHDLHGLAHGPDGRLYFSIADRGAHVTNREGVVIAMPDCGGVFRCEPDGRNLEAFARGLRNPQELAFDADGNLWTGDNNGDGGDKARWTLVLEGADYGWTIGWQWLPKMGAWNSERLWQLPGTNTAAYLVPPVAHVGHGPAGIAYYPGTGLGPAYADTFFLADFPGGVRTFRVARNGGWFGVVDAGPWLEDNSAARPEGKLLWDLYPVDVTFPPFGGVVVADWVEGWEKTGKGRLWHVTDPALKDDARIAGVRRLLAEGMSGRAEAELAALLGHEDLRVRQAAQFELAGRGIQSLGILNAVVPKADNGRARRHAVRALRQLARTPAGRQRLEAAPETALGWLASGDPALLLEACRFWDDLPLPAAALPLRRLFRHPDPQVAAEAMAAFGRIPQAGRGGGEWTADVLEALAGGRALNPLLRHAASRLMASRPARDWNAHPDPAVRMVAVLAAREARSAAVAEFLSDADPSVVLEAARAVHDVPIPEAYPALARLLDTGLPLQAGEAIGSRPFPFTREEWSGFVLRRAVNAAARMARPELAASLIGAAVDRKFPVPVRVLALECLRDWASPPRRDPLTGLIASRPAGDPAAARSAVSLAWPTLMQSQDTPALLVAAIGAARTLAIPDLKAHLEPLERHSDEQVIQAARSGDSAPVDAADRAVAGTDPSDPGRLLTGGNAARGRKLFAERADWGCQRCHKLHGEGGDVGPELAGLGVRKGRSHVLESILQPNRAIAPGFESVVVTLRDDESVVGVLREETPDTLVVQTPDRRVVVKKSDVKSRDRAASAMPDGLGDLMTRGELRDLVEALSE